MLRPWLWPYASYEEATWNKRLGRVIHWLSVVLSALIILASLTLLVNDHMQHAQSLKDAQVWHQKHDGKMGTSKGPPPWERDWNHFQKVSPSDHELANMVDFDGWSIDDGSDPAPIVTDEMNIRQIAMWSAIISILVLVLLLIGRAIRYVLGGE